MKLTGGFGNQLFCLAAGVEQARRLGCRLVLDLSEFQSSNPRDFMLEKLVDAIPEVDFSGRSPISNFKNRYLNVFRERDFKFDQRIFDVKIGDSLNGYFQSPKYFPGFHDELLELLLNLEIEKHENDYVNETCEGDYLVAHVRRGDYLNPTTQQFHGLASLQYFKKALETLAILTGVDKVFVFSDSPDTVAREFRNLPFEVKVLNPSSPLSEIATLHAMSKAVGFVMSNSSFSWWGASLMQHSANFGEAPVIAPRPWFASGESASDLLSPSWFTLGI